MNGERDLATLLASLDPVLGDEPVVFVTVAPGFDTSGALATVHEEEGLTLVLRQADADEDGLAYAFVGAWITLAVASDLAGVGLTATLSHTLASEDIPCNVLAGFHHDHLVVPWDRREAALAALRALG